MRAVALAFALTLLPAAAQAQVTTQDIIELTKAGLGEEVLLALIEVHKPVFPVDAATLKSLKYAGVAPGVIVAMVKSGRTAPPPPPVPVYVEPPPAPAPPPVVVVQQEHRHEPVVREVAVPVYVPVPVRRVHTPHVPVKRVEPVYWGYGGKLRPDAWKPTTVQDIQPDAKIPPPQKK